MNKNTRIANFTVTEKAKPYLDALKDGKPKHDTIPALCSRECFNITAAYAAEQLGWGVSLTTKRLSNGEIVAYYAKGKKGVDLAQSEKDTKDFAEFFLPGTLEGYDVKLLADNFETWQKSIANAHAQEEPVTSKAKDLNGGIKRKEEENLARAYVGLEPLTGPGKRSVQEEATLSEEEGDDLLAAFEARKEKKAISGIQREVPAPARKIMRSSSEKGFI